MRFIGHLACAGVSFIALSGPALAQDASTEGASADEIIVQARRKDESIQDVPLTVNAVSNETINKLNIRELKDITAVVPGLVLNPGNRTTGAISSLRGLNVDINSSGSNGTVEFYLNDAPTAAGLVMQALYDVGQVEVLRGPQGTLRGRASPSGSITVTTRRPDMNEFGGYAQGTLSDIGGRNVQGAVNLPIIPDFLAIRVAGLYEKNEGSRVHSIYSDQDSSSKTKSFRVGLRLTPTSDIDFNVNYTRMVRDFVIWDQVESASLATGTALPAGSRLITARDRLAVSNVPNLGRQEFSVFNMQGQWSFGGQRLNYVGSISKQDLRSTEPMDKGDFFDASYPGDASLPNNNGTYTSLAPTLNLQNLAQATRTYPKLQTHELRLSSEERIFGLFDYVVGGLISKQTPWSDLVSVRTANFTGTVSPGTYNGTISPSPVSRRGRTLERGVFGNLTLHLGENTEIAGGIRRLNYQENLNGRNNKFNATIWNASAKHRFNEALMVYANAGTSFRVGSGTNAVILQRNVSVAGVVDPFLASLLPITPERSKSYEVGFRSNFLDDRLTFNVSAFYQKFNGYIFPVAPFYILNNPTGANPVPNNNANVVLAVSSVAAPVPATVKGVEAELAFKPFNGLNFSATAAYAKAKMTDAVIPCTPAGSSTPPTAAQINLTGTQQVGQCIVNQSAGRASPFSGNVQGEYSHPVSNDYNGFVRGLVQYNGNTSNDPQNPFDNVKGYALANFYAGIRAEDGGLEVSAYVKNLFNTFRVTDRSAIAATVATNLGTRLSNYRQVFTTQPREFGITARYAFGSR